MNLLLDTCTFLWLTSQPGRLSTRALSLITDPANSCFLSSVSAWEIGVAFSLGRVTPSQPPSVFVPAQRASHGIDILPLTEEAALRAASLPMLHRDPFDRMLICQAMTHQMAIVTPDPLIRQYAIQAEW